MTSLETVLQTNYHWAHHRMDILCRLGTKEDIEEANSIGEEFHEWLDPSIDDHDILSLEYIADLCEE